MSYVSGFMLGASIGKAIHQAMFGSKKDVKSFAPPPSKAAAVKPVLPFKLVSFSAGRRRYRANYISAELSAALEEKLARLDFIKQVKVNALSGSILLTFDEKNVTKINALAKWLLVHIFTPPAKNTVAADDDSLPSEAHAGQITRSIRNSARAFSGWINKSTCGWFDISSLASLIFMLRGLRKIILTQQYPSGSQMMWWALALMRGWRTV